MSDVAVWSVPSCPKCACIIIVVWQSEAFSTAISLPPSSPLQPWIAVENEGLVICAHCNCMAGLREACCSYATALLFLLEANSQIVSCTSRPCSLSNILHAFATQDGGWRPLLHCKKKKCGALFGGFSVSTALFFNHFLLCIQYATVLVCPPHFIFYSVYISVYIIHSAV